MIVTVYENDCSKTVVSEQNRFTITVFGCELRILRIGNYHELRLPQSVTLLSKETHACRTAYRLSRDEEEARVDFFENESGFDTYRYCACEEELTIGGHVEDDIYIQDHGIPPHAITISFKDHSLLCVCDELYANGKQIHEAEIDAAAIYSVLQLRFALCRNMVVFNGPKGIFCVNEEADYQTMPIENRKPVQFISSLHKPLPALSLQVVMPEETVMAISHEDSILLSSLPSILMAMGAMASVLLMHMGKEDMTLMEYLPQLLMPVVMLVSAIVLMPLQRIMRKRKFHQNATENRKQFEREMEETEDALIIQKEAVITELEEMYVMPEMLIDQLKKGTVSCFNPYDGQFLSLRLGIAPLPFTISFQHGRNEKDERYKAFESRVMGNGEGPFVLHLQKGMCYLFKSHDALLYEEILSKLVLTHCPEDLTIIFLKGENMPVYCMMLPHAAAEGRTMMMSVGEYNKECIHMHKAHIIVAFDTLQEGLCTDYAPVIVCSHTLRSDPRFTVVCDLDTGLFENRKEQMYCHFLKDAISMDLSGIALRICLANVKAESGNMPSYLTLHDAEECSKMPIKDYWEKSHSQVMLQAICGTDTENWKIVLDLDEKKDGPHGLVAGMTGSGKSEFLISVLLDIAVHNSPKDVSFLIFDFKGGGMLQAFTFAGKLLPHIAGTLTNLDGYEMERVLYALKKTCEKRQELFVRMHEMTDKSISHIDDYRREWKEGMELPVLSHLLIVVDEFAQLKKEQPQFMDELISIARIGRSLGIHLLLATQKPAGIISEQIRANMSFTVCLRVKDVQDAIEVINDRRPAAIKRPGEFYLSSRNTIRYGRAVYLGTKGKEGTITCYDTNHQKLYSAAMKETILTMREELLEKIMETGDVQAEPVYQKLPETVDPCMLHDHHAFAVLDDYRNGKQVFLKREPVLGIWGTDRKAKEQCMRAVLYTLFDQADVNREIYLLDAEETKYDSCRNTAGIIHFFEKERLLALDERIRMKENPVTIVLFDVETFVTGGEGNEMLLHHWLKDSHEQLNLILFLRVSNDLRYRDMASVHQRAVLKGTGIQEAQAILETSLHSALSERGLMMKWEDYAAELVLPCVSEEMEDALIKRKQGQKNFALWTIPDEIPFACNDAGILLGIDKTNGRKIYVDKMPVVLTESEETKNMLEAIYQTEVVTKWEMLDLENEAVLYAGSCSAFSLPFALHINEDIKEGEGLYVCRHKTVRLKLCNRSG